MRDRGRVADRRNSNTRLTDRTDRRLSAATRAFDPDFDLTHSSVRRFASSFAGRLLGRKGRSLSRAAETAGARRRLSNKVAVGIRYRDHRVIERRRNVNDPKRNVLFLFLFVNLLFWCCHKNTCQSSVASDKLLIKRKLPPANRQLFLAWCLLLSDGRLSRSFSRSCVRMRALTTDR